MGPSEKGIAGVLPSSHVASRASFTFSSSCVLCKMVWFLKMDATWGVTNARVFFRSPYAFRLASRATYSALMSSPRVGTTACCGARKKRSRNRCQLHAHKENYCPYLRLCITSGKSIQFECASIPCGTRAPPRVGYHPRATAQKITDVSATLCIAFSNAALRAGSRCLVA
jgi:hypothetical protein